MSLNAHRNAALNDARLSSAEEVIALLSNEGMNGDASKIGGMANHEHETDGHSKRYDVPFQQKGDR